MKQSVFIFGLVVAGCAGGGASADTDLPVECASRENATEASGVGGPFDVEDVFAAAGAPVPVAAVMTGDEFAIAAFTQLGSVAPTSGKSFAWLSTGVAGAGTIQEVASADAPDPGTSFGSAECGGPGTFDCVTITYTFEAGPEDHSIRFDFRFFSTEDPDAFVDGFAVTSSDNEVVAITPSSALYTVGCDDLAGTGFEIPGANGCKAGSTRTLATIIPVEAGATGVLQFTLNDEGDGVHDSAVMLDGIALTANEVEAPSTSACE